MILYIDKSKESTKKKKLELIKFSQISDYKVNN